MGLKDGLKMLRQIRGPMEMVNMALPRHMRKQRLLNDGQPNADAPTSGLEVIRALKGLRNELKGQAYVDQGAVNYKQLGQSDAYQTLKEVSRALVHIQPSDLSDDDEKIAFFINLYNVLMIHGVIALEIEHSVMEVPTFFSTVAYRIGDHIMTPDDIEHGVLRRNAPHPTSKKRVFETNDPRAVWMPTTLDPRLHMALVCVAQSCPPIGFYSAENLELQLDMASANYVNNGIIVDHEARTVTIAAIFIWYKADFGGDKGLLDFWSKHASEALVEDLAKSVEQQYQWKTAPYDWSLNTL